MMLNVGALQADIPRPLYQYEVQVGLFEDGVPGCLARAFYFVVASTADEADERAVQEAYALRGADELRGFTYQAVDRQVLHRIA